MRTREESALLTDLYQLTMLQAYFDWGMNETAVFDFLENLRFEADELAWLAGFDGSSNVLAGMRWGIPLYGTMARSYIQAHDTELLAFEHFARSHPGATTLLIDTWDTEAAAQALLPLARKLAVDGIVIRAVRLDSGDLGVHATKVRAYRNAARILAELGRVRGLPGFGAKTEANILQAVEAHLSKAHRIKLATAAQYAEPFAAWLAAAHGVLNCRPLAQLRKLLAGVRK